MARNATRIELVLDELRRYWEKNPDLRLAQIVGNTASRAGLKDGYNMEDDTFLNNLLPYPREFDFTEKKED